MTSNHAMNGWTGIVIAALLLLLTAGCVSTTKRTAANASLLSYMPYRTATKPSIPTPYQAEHCFFGYHQTWWRAWPGDWYEMPDQQWMDEEVEELPAPGPPPTPHFSPVHY